MTGRFASYLACLAVAVLFVAGLGPSKEALAAPPDGRGNGKALGHFKNDREHSSETDSTASGDDTSWIGSTSNSAPVIGGTPAGSITEGNFYEFMPSAEDADGDSLRFTIVNQPSWADFDPTMGTLYGTPTAADVGLYSDIMIAVTDGQEIAELGAFTIEVTAIALTSANLQWQPPTQNTDGTALTNLSGYRIYYGRDSAALEKVIELSNPGLTSYVVEQLDPAVWYFAMTALNSDGLESDFSTQTMRDTR
jgi:hypothetical protein